MDDKLKILLNNEEIRTPEDNPLDTDPAGVPMRIEVKNLQINGKSVTGWVGILKKGGRQFGGFSLFQNRRQIQGYPHAWKPKSIFGGIDDEGANNLVAQRLTGVLNLDGFQVSHTKDAILFEGDEEEQLELYLAEITKDYRSYAQKRRGPRASAWSRDKVRDLVQSMAKEFSSDEMSDAVAHAAIPPIEAILANNKTQLTSVSEDDIVAKIPVGNDITVVVSLQERSEYDPHVVIVAGADQNVIYVIINGLHPYYSSLDSSDAVDECVRQYIYDTIAEYKVSKLTGKVSPDSVRRLKNDLLRIHELQVSNAAVTLQEKEIESIVKSSRGT